MKKFRFKFAAVLQVRKSHQDEALRVLGVAQRAYQNELARKAAFMQTLEASLKRREILGQEPVTIDAFLVEQDFITGTKQRLIQSDQAIFRASKNVEKALRNYLIARKQARAIEVLYDRAYEEFRKERAKREQKFLDDMVLMRSRMQEESA